MATIIAQAGRISSPPITVNRPKWSDMIKNYPDMKFNTSTLYKEISDSLFKIYSSNTKDWENSCAIRMSKALNYSGVKLPSTDIGYREDNSSNGTLKGKDGYYYWFRVKSLGNYLKKKLGKPDLDIHLKTAKLGEKKEKMSTENWKKVQAMKGIVMFEVSGWGNASGHFTLWDGNHLIYPGYPEHDNPSSEFYYFYMKYEGGNKVFQTNKILLWELK